MPQSYLLFNFDTDEETAQRARRTIEGWKQGFRLDKKLLVKFEREPADAAEKTADAAKPEEKSGDASEGQITLIVRLDFSDHEKLSHERWLARIPTEPLFKEAHPKVIRQNDAEFGEISERFQGGASRPHGYSGSAV